MFSSIGWGEIVVIIAAGLIILGPERLPGAISWTMQSIRKVRDYATGAQGKLRDEMGTDFDEFREPIKQLNELRQMTPKAVVTKHLFGGDSSTVDDLGRQVSDLGRSVRDTLDIDGVGPSRVDPPSRVDVSKIDRPAPLPSTPAEPTRPDPVKRGPASVTDWDAT